MATLTTFSEFEVRKLGFIFGEGDTASTECPGSIGDQRSTRTVTKKCRGHVKKRFRSVTGGTLTVSAHLPVAFMKSALGLTSSDFKSGSMVFGPGNKFGEFCLTAEVLDEDGNEKFIAYPKTMVSKLDRDITNHGDDDAEVAEVEFEAEYVYDDNAVAAFECFEDDIKLIFGDSATMDSLLTSFDSADTLASA